MPSTDSYQKRIFEKNKVRKSCQSSCLIYDSKTWLIEVQHKIRLNGTEISIIDGLVGLLWKTGSKMQT